MSMLVNSSDEGTYLKDVANVPNHRENEGPYQTNMLNQPHDNPDATAKFHQLILQHPRVNIADNIQGAFSHQLLNDHVPLGKLLLQLGDV